MISTVKNAMTETVRLMCLSLRYKTHSKVRVRLTCRWACSAPAQNGTSHGYNNVGTRQDILRNGHSIGGYPSSLYRKKKNRIMKPKWTLIHHSIIKEILHCWFVVWMLMWKINVKPKAFTTEELQVEWCRIWLPRLK